MMHLRGHTHGSRYSQPGRPHGSMEADVPLLRGHIEARESVFRTRGDTHKCRTVHSQLQGHTEACNFVPGTRAGYTEA